MKSGKFFTMLLAVLLAMSVSSFGMAASFTDSLGREVEVADEIQRVAPSGSMAQLVLFAIAPEMLVGIDSAWDDEARGIIPDEYFLLPELGQFYGSGRGDMNFETLLNADPQVIIDVGDQKKGMADDLNELSEQLNIPCVHIDGSLKDYGSTFRMLGKLLGKEEEGEKLGAYCDEIYSRMTAIIASVGNKKVKVLYCVGDTGTNVIPAGSYQGELLDLVCDNIAVVDNPSKKGTGNAVGMEQILLWDPEVLIFPPYSVYGTVASDEMWQQMTAVQKGRYLEAPVGPYNWMGFPPGVQRYLGLMWLTKTLYPDAASFDLYEETAWYFELFYHVELTREMFDKLTAHSAF